MFVLQFFAFAVCQRNRNIGEILSIAVIVVIIIITMIAYLL